MHSLTEMVIAAEGRLEAMVEDEEEEAEEKVEEKEVTKEAKEEKMITQETKEGKVVTLVVKEEQGEEEEEEGVEVAEMGGLSLVVKAPIKEERKDLKRVRM